MITTTSSVASHPLQSFTVTVYVPDPFTTKVGPVAFSTPGPDHTYVFSSCGVGRVGLQQPFTLNPANSNKSQLPDVGKPSITTRN